MLESRLAKETIMSSLRYLVSDGAIRLSAFVVMPNHIHLLIQPLKDKAQLRFMKYTGQQLKFYLEKHEENLLKKLEVNKADRQ